MSWSRARGRGPELVAAALALAFVAVSAWWLSADSRVPNGDAGRHLVLAKHFHDALGAGELLAPLRDTVTIDNEFYPPLVHLLGAFAAAVADYSVTSITLLDNLVFVPLLAVGTFGAASVAFDRRAGALAVLFVLGAPILISQFHVFMLDAPLTAFVALSLWLLLLSDGFARTGVAALAGAAVGLGTMIKVTLPLFVIGVVLVMLLRGGWRNWRGIAAFAGVVVLIVQPWVLFHYDALGGRADRAAAGPESPRADGPLGNYGAYLFTVLNTQLLLPLAAFAAVGTATAIRAWLRERLPRHLPELLAGGALTLLLPAAMSWFNERYTMPIVVYAAILGTGWISWQPRPRRVLVTAALAIVVVANTVMVNTGWGDHVSFTAPWERREVVIVSDRGYVEAKPLDSGVLPLLQQAADDGVDRISFQAESLNVGGFNLNGLAAFAFTADMRVIPPWEPQNLGANGVYAFRAPMDEAGPDECLVLEDGYGLYFGRGGAPTPENRYCPPA